MSGELSIFGKYGEVWDCDDGVHFKVLIYSETGGFTAKKIAAAASASGVATGPRRSVYKVEKTLLAQILKAIRIPVNPGRQVAYYKRAYHPMPAPKPSALSQPASLAIDPQASVTPVMQAAAF
ncbi:MAG: hypothetical protein H7301_05090 [Cryobacterium sp.]|nr:hypothetical protein [Oligoflexia bacterium]